MSHWPTTSPSPQAQRSTGAQWQEGNPNYRPLRNGHPVQVPPRTVSGELQSQHPGVEPITPGVTGSSNLVHLWTKGRLLPRSVGYCGTHGIAGKSSLGLLRIIMGYLRAEAKARKGRALGDLGRSKCGKQRSKGIKGTICVEAGAS